MKPIYITELSVDVFNKLQDFIQNRLREAMSVQADLSWYKDCAFSDFFVELDVIYDENDEKVGEGLDIVSAAIVLNEDTQSDFELAFEQARDVVLRNLQL